MHYKMQKEFPEASNVTILLILFLFFLPRLYNTTGQFLFGPTETSHDHNYYFIDEETLLFSSFGLKAEYNEWRPVPELATQGMISKIGVLYLNLYFQRAKNHYVSNIIVSHDGFNTIIYFI